MCFFLPFFLVAAQRSMPMALTGHCAVNINIGADRFTIGKYPLHPKGNVCEWVIQTVSQSVSQWGNQEKAEDTLKCNASKNGCCIVLESNYAY